MPSGGVPRGISARSLRVAASNTATDELATWVTQTSRPPGVNTALTGKRPGTGNASTTRREATSTTLTVASALLSTQRSAPSGERASPSAPAPVGTVSTRPAARSMNDTVPPWTLLATTRSPSSAARTMCGPSPTPHRLRTEPSSAESSHTWSISSQVTQRTGSTGCTATPWARPHPSSPSRATSRAPSEPSPGSITAKPVASSCRQESASGGIGSSWGSGYMP